MEFGHRKFTTSLQVMNESSLHGNSSTNVSWPSSSTMLRQTDEARSYCYFNASLFNNLSSSAVEQFSVYNNDNELPLEQANMVGSGRPNQTSVNFVQSVEYPVLEKNILPGLEAPQMHSQTIHGYSFQSATSSSLGWLGNPSLSQDGQLPQMHQPHFGLTKQQEHVLRAQILAFGHLKKGDGTLPFELLQAIVPPPLEEQMLKALMPVERVIQDVSSFKDVDVEDNTRHLRSTEKEPLNVNTKTGVNNLTGKEFVVDEIEILSTNNMQAVTTGLKESTSVVPIGKEEHHQTTLFTATAEYGPEFGTRINDGQTDISLDKGKAVAPEVILSEMIKVKKPSEVCNATQDKSAGPTRKYYGPLFDTLPLFTQEHDTIASRIMMNNSNNMRLAYDVKDLLFEEGREVLKRKREENIKKIDDILAANMERKRIGSDTVLRLQIEQKKLRLLDVQARLRNEIDYQQQEIMVMPVRPYRKFIRHCERQRRELIRNVQASKKAMRGKQLKSIFQWRKKLLEAHWAIRDARAARNKGVAKYHDRISKDFFKRKDDHHNKRMEALKNNDIERYREILLEQQSIPGDGAERYSVISSFLTQTEEYLCKLGCKITAAKAQQDVEEAANNAAAAARAQGLSEEDVRAAAACAGEEVIIRNRFSEMNTPTDTSSLNKYYNLAHTVNERVLRQPSMLRAGILRDYQLIGLQWMLSLYNNKLNGILADEMGLGKTVQVMSLIAHLMEFKGNCGPHLIIVPNAVLVNWKSELQNWLPSVSCIFYVGGKDQRLKLFSQEVAAKKFNVLVTTYEFIMHDRAKLSKVDWKYIIIDEAHRMKDRESVLARDLDRYRCQRRLLLTGTPLQNDLKELWSLLNLLLPEVFDNRKVFHDWFAKPFQKDVLTTVEDDWLETEKKVIIIHRLHQILEPFMLRRRVEDVEGSLPPKVSIILRCRMSPIQGAVYDWIKSTGTLRLDPDCERLIAQEKPKYQPKVLKTLHNRCMELRKTCNHPSLNYPHFNDFSKDFLVRSCGKLFVLDRILLKLQKAGHRVLLFSTMTKLLDILEEYLQWRRLVYRRIDGTTSLEERESAIVDFNSPDTECFIFLLSIRAAGRGLNLQTADTVIMYDPDPNPKNEEQAIARAHRIGQKREVKVIHLEAVVDKFTSQQVEDKYRSGGNVDSGDDLEGKDRYMGSIESLIRNNIQQSKIEMADEVINAGRFDQRTTHEERRLTLESMLHDEDRYQETVHSVPSLQEVNRMIARGQEEVELFDQMDEEFDWVEEMTGYDEVPKWLWVDTDEMDATITSLSKKSSKKISLGENVGVIFDETKPMGTRGRPRGAKIPVYIEVDEDDGSEASSEEGSEYSGVAEEETGELEDDVSGDVEAPSRNMDTKSNKHPTELDETENAISGGSLMYLQKPGSLIHDVAEGEHEQMLLTETKRKRSTRNRSRNTEERSQIVREVRLLGESNALKSDKSSSSLKAERHPHPGKVPIPRKVHTSLGPSRVSRPSEDAGAHSREIKCNKTMRANDSSLGSTMSDEVQHRCRNLMRKFQKKIEKEGPQVVPLLTKFWKRNEQKRGCGKGDLDIQKIDQKLDKFKYKGVMELVSDVQLMLKRAVQFYELSYEVRTEARKVHDLFFDILRLAFPNTDFEEARNAVCFTAQVNRSTSVGPSKHGLAGHKRQKQPNEVDLHEIRTQKRSTSHTSQHEGSAIHHVDRPGIPGLVGWSNSAKRIRTGSRRRRPSQV